MNPGNAPMGERRGTKRTEHTPTPWIATETGMDECEETFEISSMKTDGMTGGYRWFNRADAAFLVRAVNSHEELLNCLKGAMMIVKALSSDYDTVFVQEVEKAIAKAERK